MPTRSHRVARHSAAASFSAHQPRLHGPSDLHTSSNARGLTRGRRFGVGPAHFSAHCGSRVTHPGIGEFARRVRKSPKSGDRPLLASRLSVASSRSSAHLSLTSALPRFLSALRLCDIAGGNDASLAWAHKHNGPAWFSCGAAGFFTPGSPATTGSTRSRLDHGMRRLPALLRAGQRPHPENGAYRPVSFHSAPAERTGATYPGDRRRGFSLSGRVVVTHSAEVTQ